MILLRCKLLFRALRFFFKELKFIATLEYPKKPVEPITVFTVPDDGTYTVHIGSSGQGGSGGAGGGWKPGDEKFCNKRSKRKCKKKNRNSVTGATRKSPKATSTR